MDTVTLDLKDVLIRFLKKWKLNLLVVLGCALVLNMLFVYRNYRAGSQQTASQTGEKVLSLTEDEKQAVQRLAPAYWGWQENYSAMEEYLSDSLVAQLNPNAVDCVRLIYRIDMTQEPAPAFDGRDPAAPLAAAAAQLFPDEAFLKQAAELLKSGKESYIQELISTNTADNLLSLLIRGRSPEECRSLETLAKEAMTRIFSRISAESKPFSAKLAGTRLYTDTDKTLLENKRNLATQMNAMLANCKNTEAGLSPDQRTYLMSLNPSAEKQKEEPTPAADLAPGTAAKSIKWFFPKQCLLGAFAGLALCLGWQLFSALFGRHLHTENEMEQGLSISLLGALSAGDDSPEAIKAAASAIRVLARKNEKTRLLIATSSDSEILRGSMEKLAALLKEELPEIALAGPLWRASRDMEKAELSDAAVMVEGIDISQKEEIGRQAGIIRSCRIPILGYITVK